MTGPGRPGGRGGCGNATNSITNFAAGIVSNNPPRGNIPQNNAAPPLVDADIPSRSPWGFDPSTAVGSGNARPSFSIAAGAGNQSSLSTGPTLTTGPSLLVAPSSSEVSSVNLTAQEKTHIGNHSKNHKPMKNNLSKIQKIGFSNTTAANITNFQSHIRGKNAGTFQGKLNRDPINRDEWMQQTLPLFYSGPPRGQDFPRGDNMNKINGNTPVALVILGKTSSRTCPDFKMKYHISTQNPCIQLSAQGENAYLTIGCEDMILREGKDKNKFFLARASITPTIIIPEVLSACNDTLQCLGASSQTAQFLTDWMVNHDGNDIKGAELLSFRVKTARDFRTKTVAGEEIASFTLAGPVDVIVIRSSWRVKAPLDEMIDCIFRECADGGAYWWYTRQLVKQFPNAIKGENLYALHVKGLSDGTSRPMDYPFWLAPVDGSAPTTPDVPNKIYDSQIDFYHCMSIGIVREFQNSQAFANTAFGIDKPHTAKIISVSATQVTADFKITRPVKVKEQGQQGQQVQQPAGDAGGDMEIDPDDLMEVLPPIPSDRVRLRLVASNPYTIKKVSREFSTFAFGVGKSSPSTAPATASDSMEVEGSTPEIDTAQVDKFWPADIIDSDKDSGYDFRVSFTIKEDERSLFLEGANTQFTIQVLTHALPVLRQLKAINRFSKPLRPLDKLYNIQNLIFCKENAEGRSLWDICQTEQLKVIARTYYHNVLLNQLQAEVVQKSFLGNKLLTQVLGPPGTGKSSTNSVCAMLSAILGFRTLVVAPANIPVYGLFDKIVNQKTQFETNLPAWRGLVQVIYFQTLHTTRAALLAKQDPQNSFNQYCHWYYIKEYIRSIADGRIGSEAEVVASCSGWMACFNHIQNGETLTAQDEKSYLELAMMKDIVTACFKNTAQTLIVLTTSNNAAQLIEWGIEFQVVETDELAYGLAPDSMIPLACGPIKIIASGDRHQLTQALQGTRSNEKARELTFTLFERWYQVFKNSVTQLQINYRMHPRICKFPAMARYKWLGCGQDLSTETLPYKFMKAFWNSEHGESFRIARRELYGLKPEEEAQLDCRRLVFDFPSAVSAPAEGDTSQRNFMIIKFIVMVLKVMSTFVTKDGIAFDKSWFPIAAPYKAELTLLLEQLGIHIKVIDLTDMKSGTIISMQGDESAIVIFAFTPANPVNPASIGYLADWRQGNAVLTRAKDCVWTLGNFSKLEEQLYIIGTDPRANGTKNWALFLMDVERQKDKIPVKFWPNKLAKDDEEAAKPPSDWTRRLEKVPEEAREFKAKWQQDRRDSVSSVSMANSQTKTALLLELDRMEKAFDKEEEKFQRTLRVKANEAAAIALFQRFEKEAAERDKLAREEQAKNTEEAKLKSRQRKMAKDARETAEDSFSNINRFEPLLEGDIDHMDIV